MSFRMVPISQLFDRFPTQVREMARQLGKRVKLEVSGAQTELDKVLDRPATQTLIVRQRDPFFAFQPSHKASDFG